MNALLQQLSSPTPSNPLKLTDIALVDKVEWMQERIKGKDVLHVGATDYPGTDFKASVGDLLHLQLKDYQSLVGVDLSAEGIQYLKETFGTDNIIQGDAERLDDLFPEKQFDVIVAGDIIEHLNNPGGFLASARKVLKDDGVLLITTPNSFAIKRMMGAIFLRAERNNPDHLYFFSLMTLWQAASRFGYQIRDVATFMYEAPYNPLNRRGNMLSRFIMKLTRNNFLADELAVAFVKRGE